ncbi:probable G-protein coupled receptor 27 [Perognathus longimembris pacificus]|uniref:probable G-protein coupled receptor 27 n=1 Tax=Perognathus longimembris pacificus TaxID=214514 RepID=UPI0020190023|nr:probable G-protein coupled receptor 27 [Perognathus longimembris pacificus]
MEDQNQENSCPGRKVHGARWGGNDRPFAAIDPSAGAQDAAAGPPLPGAKRAWSPPCVLGPASLPAASRPRSCRSGAPSPGRARTARDASAGPAAAAATLRAPAEGRGLGGGGGGGGPGGGQSQEGGGGGGGEAAALGLKLATLSLLLCVSLAGNVLFALLIVRERSLHRAPYYLLLDLCLADGLRALACLPAVMLAARRAAAAAGSPPPGALGCKLLAFLAALFCFHAAFLLLGVGVTRYLAIAHHRFYAERLAGWPCAAMLVCAAWALALAAAFPPVLDGGGGGGGGDDEDAPCALEQRPDGAPGALGFLLLLAVVVGATHLVYLRLLFFIHDRRKMRPARLVPAVSHDWTFHGPGATGQAAANWTAGFGRGPTPPALVGIRPAGPGRGARRLLVLEEFKTEKRLCKMFYAVTLLFLLLWGPYVVASYLRVLVRPGAVPQAYLTASVWLTFAQAGINPVVCFLFNRELRDCFRAQFPCCQSPQPTQAALPCDLKGIGL